MAEESTDNTLSTGDIAGISAAVRDGVLRLYAYGVPDGKLPNSCRIRSLHQV